MGIYALSMMDIAIEIAVSDSSFEDSVTKFYEHFVYIAEALNEMGLWNHEDHFFYDTLCMQGFAPFQLKVRSVVGLTSLFAVSILNKVHLEKLTDFSKRIRWFSNYRMNNQKFIANEQTAENENILVSLIHKDKLVELLHYILSESEFLSNGGVRALSKCYLEHPYEIKLDGISYTIQYDPGDSTSGLFGGNSNWRGPVWMPVNYLLIQSIEKFYLFYGDSLKVEFPTGSGEWKTLHEVATELKKRIISIFQPDAEGNRPVHGRYNSFYKKPENQHLVLFYEYLHGDSSMGMGASHQTGWTALIATLIYEV
jgi:hypothetical protein